MKLNLLPTSVSRERNVRKALMVSITMVLASIVVAASMITTSKNALQDAKAAVNADQPSEEATVAIAAQADTIINQAVPFLRNKNLVVAIDAHTKVYPEFYDKLRPLIPDFYRVTSMRATPATASSVTVSLAGVIKNSLFTDLKFALMRIPSATNLQVSAVPINPGLYVPNVTPGDEEAHIRPRNAPPIPDDGMARLNQALARGGVSGYLSQGNFGSGTPQPRLAMPDSSVVNVTFILPGQLQAPNVRATLAAVGPAPAPTAPPAATAAAAPAPGGKAPTNGAKPKAGAPPAKTAPGAPAKAQAAAPAPVRPGAAPAKAGTPAKTAPATKVAPATGGKAK